MAITRTKKEELVSELVDKLGRIEAAVFADYQGLTVRASEELRRNLREHGMDFMVVKNRIFVLAAEQTGIKVDKLIGTTGVAFGYDDTVMTAKVMAKFAKENDALEIRGGIVDGEQVDTDMIVKLSKLPSREELLGRLVGSISAPARNLAGVLSAVPRNLVYALRAVHEQKA